MKIKWSPNENVCLPSSSAHRHEFSPRPPVWWSNIMRTLSRPQGVWQKTYWMKGMFTPLSKTSAEMSTSDTAEEEGALSYNHLKGVMNKTHQLKLMRVRESVCGWCESKKTTALLPVTVHPAVAQCSLLGRWTQISPCIIFSGWHRCGMVNMQLWLFFGQKNERR